MLSFRDICKKEVKRPQNRPKKWKCKITSPIFNFRKCSKSGRKKRQMLKTTTEQGGNFRPRATKMHTPPHSPIEIYRHQDHRYRQVPRGACWPFPYLSKWSQLNIKGIIIIISELYLHLFFIFLKFTLKNNRLVSLYILI